MSTLLALPLYRLTDSNGVIIPSGRLYTFLTGTTTPAATYTTAALNVSHGAYVQANSAGLLPPIYLDPAVSYRFQVRISPYSAAVSGMDFDPVTAPAASDIIFDPPGTGSQNRTMQAKAEEIGLSPLDFGCVGGAIDETSKLQLWLNALAGGKRGIVPDGYTFGYSDDLTIKSGTRVIEGLGGTLKALDDASIILEHDLTDLRLEGLIIDVNDKLGQGIWGHNNQRLEILNNRVLNCSDGCGILVRADTIYSTNVSDLLIQGNYVDCVGAAANQFGIWVDCQLEGDALHTWTHDGTSNASGTGDQGAAVGTLVTCTRTAKNVRIIGNEVIGGYYAIGGFFLEEFVIEGNTIRDLGSAVDGPTRGIALEYPCKNGSVTGNKIRNTQSSSIQISYGCDNIAVTGNTIYNNVSSHGTVGIDGSQAIIQVQVGCTDILVANNRVKAPGGANGPEFMVNIGPHSHRVSIVNNKFYGKVAKAGINVESTYDSSAMRATAYASGSGSGVGFTATSWATTTLADVEIIGNTINLTGAKAGIQVIQAASISISGLVLRDNIIKGSATANSLIVSSGTLGYGSGTQLTGSATDDVGSIAAARIGTQAVTVTGAAVGDYITGLSTSAAIDAGLQMTAEVTAANTVTVKLGNLTAGAVDPASMTYYVEVTKR